MPETLAALAAEPETYRLALVTGNLEPVAHRKLAAAGIGHFFARGQGGFGSDAEERGELPAIARARAGGWARERTVVIGDTPRDIACARVDRVRVIAVATGPYTAEALADADAVVDDARAALPVLGTGPRPASGPSRGRGRGRPPAARPRRRRRAASAPPPPAASPDRSQSMPVTAPISPFVGGVRAGVTKSCPKSVSSACPSGEAMNAGSACVTRRVALRRARRRDGGRAATCRSRAARAGPAAPS